MKKVWKGWVNKDTTPNEIFGWDYDNSLAIYDLVERTKGCKIDWMEWPPKKVTITVEVED